MIDPGRSFLSTVSSVASIALLVLEASRSQATTAGVPDQYASIQLALASLADTILVKPGSYDSVLVIDRAVVLTAYPPVDDIYPAEPSPRVGSVRINSTGSVGMPTLISQFRITGGVRFHTCLPLTFQECRVDSGIIQDIGSCGSVRIRGCVVIGGIDLSPEYAEISSCSVLGEGVRVRTTQGGTRVFNNLIFGPGAFGIRLSGSDASSVVSDNLVAGYTTGISIVVGDFGPSVSRNEIRDCLGNGCTIAPASAQAIWSGTMNDNWIHRCGAHGFDLSGFVGTIRNNMVDSVGGAGVRLAARGVASLLGNSIVDVGAHGVWQSGGTNRVASARDNLILGAGADGISFGFGGADSVVSNVIGHPAGRGLYANTSGYSRIVHNTVYSCGADGISVIGGASDSIRNNIAANNLGCGLRWSGTGTPGLSCNDWFANASGAVCGAGVGSSDLQVDPQFCNLPEDDVSLASTSPLLGMPSCGVIGARGQGCAAPAGVQPPDATGVTGLIVRPMPSRGEMTVSWPQGLGDARLDVFDVAGSRRWSAVVLDGRHGVTWDGRDDHGLRLPAGAYFVRLRAGTWTNTARVLLLK